LLASQETYPRGSCGRLSATTESVHWNLRPSAVFHAQPVVNVGRRPLAEATLMARRVSYSIGAAPILTPLFLLWFIVAAGAPARAQQSPAVTGVVIDRADSVIPGARITVT